MTADLPHTLYYKTDKKGNPIIPVDVDDESVRLNEMSLKRHREMDERASLERLFEDADNDNE